MSDDERRAGFQDAIRAVKAMKLGDELIVHVSPSQFHAVVASVIDHLESRDAEADEPTVPDLDVFSVSRTRGK